MDYRVKAHEEARNFVKDYKDHLKHEPKVVKALLAMLPLFAICDLGFLSTQLGYSSDMGTAVSTLIAVGLTAVSVASALVSGHCLANYLKPGPHSGSKMYLGLAAGGFVAFLVALAVFTAFRISAESAMVETKAAAAQALQESGTASLLSATSVVQTNPLALTGLLTVLLLATFATSFACALLTTHPIDDAKVKQLKESGSAMALAIQWRFLNKSRECDGGDVVEKAARAEFEELNAKTRFDMCMRLLGVVKDPAQAGPIAQLMDFEEKGCRRG